VVLAGNAEQPLPTVESPIKPYVPRAVTTQDRGPKAFGRPKSEQWNDVPPASDDNGTARDSLKGHIKKLVEQLANR
jgi:hypothetical protein